MLLCDHPQRTSQKVDGKAIDEHEAEAEAGIEIEVEVEAAAEAEAETRAGVLMRAWIRGPRIADDDEKTTKSRMQGLNASTFFIRHNAILSLWQYFADAT